MARQVSPPGRIQWHLSFGNHGEDPIDLVISDLVMHEMNGQELIEQVRKRYEEIPVVVVTANGSVESAVDAMWRRAYDYLEKPINPVILRITIQHALNTTMSSAKMNRLKDC